MMRSGGIPSESVSGLALRIMYASSQRRHFGNLWRLVRFTMRARAKKKSVFALTSRETEVAHLVGKGLSNPEVAAELFISRKAVEYHLGNIYAKCGLQGRQELRRYVEQWHQPATA